MPDRMIVPAVEICFAHGETQEAVTHLRNPERPTHTLCGLDAFMASLTRRRITCGTCRERKPKKLGGTRTGSYRISDAGREALLTG